MDEEGLVWMRKVWYGLEPGLTTLVTPPPTVLGYEGVV